MDPTPSTAGRRRPHRRTTSRLSKPTVAFLSPETVAWYRAITAEGRPYLTPAYTWDLVVLGAQHLLLFPPVPQARHQAVLRRALAAVAMDRPPTFAQALRQVILEYSVVADGGPVTGRRLLHAVATVEEWDGQGWRQPPAVEPHPYRRGRGDAPRSPGLPRGAASAAYQARMEPGPKGWRRKPQGAPGVQE